jgi:hypothetical protein
MFPEANLNEDILVTRCMENSGFLNGRAYRLCNGRTENGKHVPNNLPACQPDAVIPKRSVENRLNSLYCQYYSKVAMCQPIYDPHAPQSSASSQSVSVTSSVAPSTDPATKLQNQVQKDSNAQMNQLLQGAGGRK